MVQVAFIALAIRQVNKWQVSGSTIDDGDGYMAFVITEPCIDVKDATCVQVCPVDCIYGLDDANERIVWIAPE